MNFILLLGLSMGLSCAGIFFIFHFAKNYPSQRVFENGFRMLLVVAVLNAYFLLCFLLSLEKIGGDISSYYRTLLSVSSGAVEFEDANRTLFLMSAIFVHLAGIVIPALTFLYLRFSGWLSITSISRWTTDMEQATKNRPALRKMQSLFSSLKQRANVKYPVEWYLVGKSKGLDVSWGCQIMKRGKKLNLIIDENLLQHFESGKIDEDEIEAIFSHEVGHIHHRDYLLPLWAKYLVYTIFPLPIAMIYSVAFLFSAIAKSNGIHTLLTGFLFPSLTIFLVTYFIRIVLLQIVGFSMREREYLADFRACESGVPTRIMAGILKKICLLFTPKEALFKEFCFTGKSSSSDTQSKLNRFMKFLRGDVSFYPLMADRIKAIEEARYSLNNRKIELLPIGEMVIATLLLAIFSLTVGSSFDMFQKASFEGPLAIFLMSMMTPLIISMLSCMPLRFIDSRTLEIAFVPGPPDSQSVKRAFLLFLALFHNKYWIKVHRSNAVTLLIVWVLALPFLAHFYPGFIRHFIYFLPMAFIGCTGFCCIFVINCISSKYRAEEGIMPIIRW